MFRYFQTNYERQCEEAAAASASEKERETDESTGGGEGSSSTPPTEWPCPTCTYLNHILEESCDICGDGKRKDVEGQGEILQGVKAFILAVQRANGRGRSKPNTRKRPLED
jgi:hypothetical protein